MVCLCSDLQQKSEGNEAKVTLTKVKFYHIVNVSSKIYFAFYYVEGPQWERYSICLQFTMYQMETGAVI